MDFDDNMRILCREMEGFLPSTPAEEKANILEKYFARARDIDKAKMLFFLILNTKLEISRELEFLHQLYHLIGACPRISLNDLCVIIIELELISALCDIVRTCPIIVSAEILSCLYESIYRSENKYEYCKKLAVAVHEKFCKIFYDFHKESNSDSAFHIFSLFLPSAYKSFGSELERVLSDINCQLLIWRDCLNLRKIEDNSNFWFSFDDPFAWNPISAELNEPPYKTIEYFSNFLSDFRSILEDHFDGKDSEMRKIVCESAYFLHETIKGKDWVSIDKEYWLESIMRDEFSGSDIFTAIDKVSNYKFNKRWFKRLISFPNWFEIEEAISSVTRHFELMDSEDSKTIIDSLRTANCGEKFKDMYLKCFERMSMQDQIVYFERHFEENPNFNWEITDGELTKTFNKLNAENKMLLITTCIRSPLKTITELCRFTLWTHISIKDSIQYLEMLKAACFSPLGDGNIISEVMKSLVEKCDISPTESKLLVFFTEKLEESKFLDFTFVKYYILKLIKRDLKKENFPKIILYLELLKIFLKKISQIEQVVLIAFFVRVLSHASWDFLSFTMELAQTKELIIEILKNLMKSFNNFNVDHVTWLRQEILKSSQMNRMYFCDFLYSGNQSIISKDVHLQLLALIHSETQSQQVIDSIAINLKDKKFSQLRIIFILALIKLLPVLTSKEWITLFDRMESILATWSKFDNGPLEEEIDLVVTDFLTVSVYCLARSLNKQGVTSSCFEFCIRNYGRVIEKKFILDRDNKTEVRIDLANKIAFLLAGIEDTEFQSEMACILCRIFLELTNPGSGDGIKEDSLHEMGNWFKGRFIRQSF